MSECCAELLIGRNFVQKSTKQHLLHRTFALSLTGLKKVNNYGIRGLGD